MNFNSSSKHEINYEHQLGSANCIPSHGVHEMHVMSFGELTQPSVGEKTNYHSWFQQGVVVYSTML